jgi:hypothetical protein
MSDITDDTNQRLRIDVPKPKVIFSLGQPNTDFGYIGLSLKADNVYWSIGDGIVLQNSGSTAHVTSQYYTVFCKKDLTLSTNLQGNVVSKRLLVLAAGAGYMDDVIGDTGASPYTVTFNDTDFGAIVRPCTGGVRGFDTALATRLPDFQAPFGAVSLVQAAQAKATGLAAAVAALAKFLVGAPADPTDNSLFVAEFYDDPSLSLLGVLNGATQLLNKVDRYLQRPETLPFVGPILAKVKTAQNAVTAATNAWSSMQAVANSALAVPASEAKEAKSFDKDAKATQEGDWNSRANAAMKLPTTDVIHMLRPIRDVVRNVRDVSFYVSDCVQQLCEFFNLTQPPPGALGLFGKHGVSVVTPDRFFGFAADGFHFVSAAKAGASGFGKLLDVADNLPGAKAFKDWLTPDAPRPSPAIPGFFVQTSGNVELESLAKSVRLHALGAASTVQVRGYQGTEVSGDGGLLLSGRHGPVEVLGTLVSIGIATLSNAKTATLTAIALVTLQTAADVAREARDAAAKAWNDAQTKIKTLQTVLVKLSESRIRTLTSISTATTTKGQLVIAQAEATAKEIVRDAAQTVFAAAELTLATAQQGLNVTTGSKLFNVFGFQETSQALASNVTVASTDAVDLFAGKTMTLLSNKVTVTAQETPLAPIPSGSMELTASQVTIKVGLLCTITVANDAITIAHTAGTSVKVDATGVTATAPGSSLKLTATGIEGSGPTVKLSGSGTATIAGSMINIG